jgi:hypothetical protein
VAAIIVSSDSADATFVSVANLTDWLENDTFLIRSSHADLTSLYLSWFCSVPGRKLLTRLNHADLSIGHSFALMALTIGASSRSKSYLFWCRDRL